MADTQTAPKKVCKGCGTYEGHSHLPGCWVETRAEYEARSAPPPVAEVPSGDTALPELTGKLDYEGRRRSVELEDTDTDNPMETVAIIAAERERQLRDYKAKYEAAQRTIEELRGNR